MFVPNFSYICSDCHTREWNGNKIRRTTLKIIDMQNKLQELTDRLYNEGLSKGKQEGEAILNDAKARAEEIIAGAKEEAAKIIAAAEKDAEDLRTKVTGDLKMAAEQSISATKQEIGTLITGKIADKEIASAMTSADFVKEIIRSVAKAFNPADDSPADIALVLPESLKKELEPFVKKEIAEILGKKVEATFSKKVSGGFTIGPKDGGWFISFTDETFKELISGYLRPATKKILFG